MQLRITVGNSDGKQSVPYRLSDEIIIRKDDLDSSNRTLKNTRDHFDCYPVVDNIIRHYVTKKRWCEVRTVLICDRDVYTVMKFMLHTEWNIS